MTAYQSKAKKTVAFPSTHQPSIAVADNAEKISESVKDYNDLKYGVNIVDQMAREYMVRTFTREWPIYLFHNAQHLAAINTWNDRGQKKKNVAKGAFLAVD